MKWIELLEEVGTIGSMNLWVAICHHDGHHTEGFALSGRDTTDWYEDDPRERGEGYLLGGIRLPAYVSGNGPELMTAREFLEYAGYGDTEENLCHLSRYLESRVDFLSFPDAFVYGEDGTPLSECLDEPVAFQEYMQKNNPRVFRQT